MTRPSLMQVEVGWYYRLAKTRLFLSTGKFCASLIKISFVLPTHPCFLSRIVLSRILMHQLNCQLFRSPEHIVLPLNCQLFRSPEHIVLPNLTSAAFNAILKCLKHWLLYIDEETRAVLHSKESKQLVCYDLKDPN